MRPKTATWKIECPYPPYEGRRRKPTWHELTAYSVALHAVNGDTDDFRGVAVLDIKVFPKARKAGDDVAAAVMATRKLARPKAAARKMAGQKVVTRKMAGKARRK